MIRVFTILAGVVALAVSAAPTSAVSDSTSNTRLAAYSPPKRPPTPPGVPIPYPNSRGPVSSAYAPDQVERELGRRVLVAGVVGPERPAEAGPLQLIAT